MSSIVNPILPGFYPDPSICAVGKDFYIVNSTFAYFPGVPIFHTRDFEHIEQIGNVLTRDSQLPLEGAKHSGGIYAPTLRYHDGTFYMITTNVLGGGNFIVTAKNPAGPWSEPYWLKGAEGIDPSLFFDDDGTCYYVGTRADHELERYYGDNEIYISRLDLDTMQLTGDCKKLWKGAMQNSVWAEGPHLYKINGYYYLLIAEGGTAAEHSICVARSQSVFGPYEGCLNNPIFTHRHLGSAYPVKNVGHGDLVQAEDGSWYILMLASRPCEGYSNLGRETFLARVEWENGWPVVNPGEGRLLPKMQLPFEEYPLNPQTGCLRFDEMSPDRLDPRLLFLRNPNREHYLFGEWGLRMKCSPITLCELSSPTWVGIRQTSFRFVAETKLSFRPRRQGEFAGITIVQNNQFHIRMEYGLAAEGNCIRAVICEDGQESVAAAQTVNADTIQLKMMQYGQKLYLYYKANDMDEYLLLAGGLYTGNLSTERTWGFVGCTIGLYVTSNGNESSNSADFRFLVYENLPV
ncbi:glycoside hydrolase family 43 protein [Acetanaerobacterium elongatum]|uniref:Alpha-N-arabinofuranosidase n=1 Tax=Acetanaerobacterium elongatum TaxID=258515 RepID=A0A1H0DAD4_9FIRM|nr:glycoside hydrolase family 43 protein [Acetanaerobacterium elongatum]SDN67058.1 alpha-N-arabinofuranosidase [Acetanaerobacterium elongatum]